MLAQKRVTALFTLILAGEVIFFLPFVIPRLFRPTLLDVFGITNLELGTYYSVYGLVAIGAYFFGGPLADRFPPNKLMAAALAATGLGGLYLFTIPLPTGMLWLYGFWGMTTILLFWASLMRATRVLGGINKQGFAFGLLDGGRGAVAALVGSLAVGVLAWFLPAEVSEATQQQQHQAFQKVILFFTAFVFITMLLVYWVLRSVDTSSEASQSVLSWGRIKKVTTLPTVWLQAIIIICAYSGYRVLDDVSLLAKDVLGYDEVQAAGVAGLSLWIRPIAAIGAGLIADRVSTSRITQFGFLIMLLGGLVIGLGPVETQPHIIVIGAIISTCIGVFALRGLYFAIMEEGRIPVQVTGTAVGLASVLGYLPDVYMGPLMGVLLDEHPGPQGHQYVFMLLIGFAVIGLLTTILFRRIVRFSKEEVIALA